MPVFEDQRQLYGVLQAFFERLTAHDEITDALVAGRFVLRFRYRDPDGQVTIDLREKPIRWRFGECELVPDLDMIQSADVSHEFWLGRLNVPVAIATRRVVARGPVAKALKLLPAVRPAHPIYAATLRELGLDALLPAERARGNRAVAPFAWMARLARRRGPSAPIEPAELPIPLCADAA